MNLSPVTVVATDIQPGDRTSRDGKTRYAQVHMHNGRVLAKTETRGTRSPSIRTFEADERVTVWRKP